MEADLSHFHGLDLRDLHRFDEQGYRKLTLRMVWVRIRHLAPTSALAIADNGGTRPWSATEYLLADLWELQANKGLKRGQQPRRHPSRPVVTNKRGNAQSRKHRAAMNRHRRKYQAHYEV